VCCLAWIALLAFMNARERMPEIGILRAIGVKSGVVLWTFMARALSAGLIGVGIAMLAVLFVGEGWKEGVLHGFPLSALFKREEVILLILFAPVLSGIAAWIPSLYATQKDPATVLHRD
jgi:putative ABC transport system permease protein